MGLIDRWPPPLAADVRGQVAASRVTRSGGAMPRSDGDAPNLDAGRGVAAGAAALLLRLRASVLNVLREAVRACFAFTLERLRPKLTRGYLRSLPVMVRSTSAS